MSKITDSARGEQCQVRIPGVCNRDPATVVFAHLNGGGMGMKHPDYEGAYCCSACHDVVDGRVPYITHEIWPEAFGEKAAAEFSRCVAGVCFYEGCVRTRKILIEKGLLICL